MIWLALALAYLGMACFALGMRSHHRTVLNRNPGEKMVRLVRFTGVALTLLAVLAAVRAHGWQVGLVLACVGVSLGGFVVTQMLAYAPRWIVAPGIALSVMAGAAWIIS